METSFLASYAKSDLGQGAVTRQRRYTGSIAYKFTDISAIEISYTVSRTKITQLVKISAILDGSETRYETQSNDKIYSINWVQNLVPSKFIIQPYIKIGFGRILRKQVISYPDLGLSSEASQEVDTGVGGVGLRIFLKKNWAIKGEFTTYVPEFRFSRWKDTQMFSAGLTWIF